MEPASFFGFQMLILEIPFALIPAEKPCQKTFIELRGVFRAQLVQNKNILPDFFPRYAQQALDVRADIIHLGGLCVQHQENVVHVHRKLLEQLVPVRNLGILKAQDDMASAHDQQND